MLYKVHCLACFVNEYEDDFVKAMIGQSARVTENEQVRKQRELDGLLARDKELDRLFEKIYEDTVLVKFPLYCPKCKKEMRIDVVQFKMIMSK